MIHKWTINQILGCCALILAGITMLSQFFISNNGSIQKNTVIHVLVATAIGLCGINLLIGKGNQTIDQNRDSIDRNANSESYKPPTVQPKPVPTPPRPSTKENFDDKVIRESPSRSSEAKKVFEVARILRLTNKLKQSGWFFVGAGWCGYTKKQLQELKGGDLNGIHIDADNITDEETKKLVKKAPGFPCWMLLKSPNKGEVLKIEPGFKSLVELEKIAGLSPEPVPEIPKPPTWGRDEEDKSKDKIPNIPEIPMPPGNSDGSKIWPPGNSDGSKIWPPGNSNGSRMPWERKKKEYLEPYKSPSGPTVYEYGIVSPERSPYPQSLPKPIKPVRERPTISSIMELDVKTTAFEQFRPPFHGQDGWI